ncbi:MAG: PEP-CTERM sorting domain-containing protein [Planctomycetota bacterium]
MLLTRMAPSVALALAIGLPSTADASAGSLTTIFAGQIPGGLPAADGSDLDDLLGFTDFAADNLGNEPAAFDNTPNLGEVLFIQNVPYYVSGSTRGYGFAGPGRADITFTPGVVTALELEVRGSQSGDSVGPTAPNTTLPNSTPLADSDLTVLVWSELGIEFEFSPISNSGFQTLSIDISDLAFLGESITRISLINEGPADSLADIGRLSVEVVPEPASAALIAMGLTVLARRRR